MEKKSYLSIETCLRWLQSETTRVSFLTLQIPLNKKLIDYDNCLTATVKHKNQTIWRQILYIYSDKIVFLDSHEDPTLQDENIVFVNIHLPDFLLKDKPDSLEFKIEQNNTVHFLKQLDKLPYEQLFHTLHSKIEDDCILSDKDCQLTFHLGESSSQYHEEEFFLKANFSFNFKKYLKDYSYIGVQCSYENQSPEIEEKHILKGQKGIYETASIVDKNLKYNSSILFSEKYLNIYDISEMKNFKKILSIDEIVFYHKDNPIQFFEIDYQFLVHTYKSSLTYSQSNLYTEKQTKGTFHIDNQVCLQCNQKSICMQTVPSGLSYDLMKENIRLEESEHTKCRIYQLISTI